MKSVEVKDQVRLSLRKCLELVLSGVRFRLFRAAITVVIISLAVAFLMTILAEGTTAREVAAALGKQTAPRRLFLLWVSRVSSGMKVSELTQELYTYGVAREEPKDRPVTEDDRARIAAAKRRLKELTTWGGLTDAELERLIDVARRQVNPRTGCQTFLASLTEGQRRPMVGNVRGSRILELLQDAEKFTTFENELSRLGKAFPISMAEFGKFLAEWRQTQPLRGRILAGHAAAVEKAKAVFGDSLPRIALATAPDDVPAKLGALGFELTADELKTVRVQAALARDAETISRSLGSSFLKAMLARRRDEKVPKVSAQMLFDEIQSEVGAAWFRELTDSSRGFGVVNLNAQRTQDAALSQVPLTQARLCEDLRKAVKTELSWQAPATWGQLSADQMRGLVDLALWQDPYDLFFKNLNPKDRKDLLGPDNPMDPFGRLLKPGGFEQFKKQLKSHNRRFPEAAASAQALREQLKKEMEAKVARISDAKERNDARKEELARLPEQMFRHFLDQWQETRELRDRIIRGRQAGLAAVHEVLGTPALRQTRRRYVEKICLLHQMENTEVEALRKDLEEQVDELRKAVEKAKADSDEGKRLQAWLDVRSKLIGGLRAGNATGLRTETADRVAELGRRLEAQTAAARKALAESAKLKDPVAGKLAGDTMAAADIASLLTVPLIRQQAALRRRIKPYEIEKVTEAELFEELSGKAGAEWFAELVGKVSGLGPLGMSIDRIREVAEDRLEQSRLRGIEANVSEAAGTDEDGDGFFAGFSARTAWLIVVSFIVCIVGIANAMLMSVTERFREIATMKCLGATDGFIMINFVLESCLQGLVGGVIGAVLGVLLGIIRATVSYGLMSLEHMPWGDIFQMAGLSMVVGLAISALAAVYPAWAAARLAPMEAMRIE